MFRTIETGQKNFVTSFDERKIGIVETLVFLPSFAFRSPQNISIQQIHQDSIIKGDLCKEEQRSVLGDEIVPGAFAHRQKVSWFFYWFWDNLWFWYIMLPGAFAHRQKVSSVFESFITLNLRNLLWDCAWNQCYSSDWFCQILMFNINAMERGLVFELGVSGEEEMEETLVGWV